MVYSENTKHQIPSLLNVWGAQRAHTLEPTLLLLSCEPSYLCHCTWGAQQGKAARPGRALQVLCSCSQAHGEAVLLCTWPAGPTHVSCCLLALFADKPLHCPAQAFPTTVPCQQIHAHLCLTAAEAKCWSAWPRSSPAQAPPHRAMRSFIPESRAGSHHYQLLSEQLLGNSNIHGHYSPHQCH